MSYAGRFGRVVLLGIVALLIAAFGGSAFLILDSIPLQNLALAHLWELLQATFFISIFGLVPVLVYATPIFTAYLSSSSFKLVYVLVLAALPGLVLLLLDSLLWPYFLPFGLGVAVVMEVVSRLWPERFGRDAA